VFFLPKRLKNLGYPEPECRRDLWATPRAAIGLPGEYRDLVSLLYWKGRPRAVISHDVPTGAVFDYALGPAFDAAPPLLIFCDSDTISETLALVGSSYKRIDAPAPWTEIEKMPAGQISAEQAESVIAEIARENRRWFEDERSQRIVGALPRIFPEGTVILYELLQNATDSDATRAAFRLDGGSLTFLHDGDPFTENDVFAISFVNWSLKPPETIGFMGLGFKAAYEVSSTPEIHSPPYFFFFDGDQEGGALLPMPLPTDAWQHVPKGFTTLFRLPLKANATGSIWRELERFDAKLLLYIGRQLRVVETPRGISGLRPVGGTDNTRHVVLEDILGSNPRNFLVFGEPFTPSEEAVNEFARSRNANPEAYRQRTQQVSIAIELQEGHAVTDSEGHLQVYLPTSIALPFYFDIQGNFLIDASRRQLRYATGPWNSEHFAQLGKLLVSLLRHSKNLALVADQSWASFYDLLPSWDEIPERFSFLDPEAADGLSSPTARTIFGELLLDDELIPVVDEHGRLAFVNPNEATYIEPELEDVFQPADLATLANVRPLWPELSQKAKKALEPYVGEFDAVELAKCLQGLDWERKVSAFNEGLETPTARRLLIHILAYLQAHIVELSVGLVDNGMCRVILTEDRHLHAKLEEGLPPIRSLPATEVDFPQEELRKQYELVHRTLLRDLRHPGESGLEPAPAHDALAILTQLAPELTADVIAKEIIHPAFQETNWKDIPDDRLFRYTRFLLENSARIAISSIQLKVRVRGLERLYLPPAEVYFGREYALDGERMEQLCGTTAGIQYLSGEYLASSSRIDRVGWVNFFSGVGVASRPRVFRHTQHIRDSEIEKVREEVKNPELSRRDLRASSIKDEEVGEYIPWDSYSIDDYHVDSFIMSRVHALYQEKAAGWKEGLRAFAVLIEGDWSEYAKYCHKVLRYALKRESYIHRLPQPALTSFGKLLKEERWLPALDLNDAFRPCELVLPTEDNKELASEETVFAIHAFTDNSLIEFLDVHKIPPESTPMQRLRGLVQRKNTELDRFKALYKEIAEDSTLTHEVMRQVFSNEALIFVPGHDEHYLPLGRVLFRPTTMLRPHFAAIGEVYGELADFFCERLGLPKDEEIDHYARFLKEYAWVKKPPMADALRDAVVSCYRKLLHYLTEHGEEETEDAVGRLNSFLGEHCMVFCGPTKGWVETADKLVVYPDTSNYLNYVEEKANIPIESHIKRLERSVVEVEPLLKVLNLKPVSAVINERPTLAATELLSNSGELRDRLVRLLSRSIEVARSLDADTESVRPRFALFLREWESLAPKLGNVSFFHCPSIQVAVYIRSTGSLVYEGNLRAYAYERSEGIDIYLAGEILEVYDVLFDHLSRILKLDLLPAEVRDTVGRIISGNIARLDHLRFPQLLGEFLIEHGLAKEEDRDLGAKLVQAATGLAQAGAESEGGRTAGVTSEGEGSTQGFPAAETSTVLAGPGTVSPSGQIQGPIPSVEDILAQLPEFSDDSFADDSIVELKREEWGTVPISHRPAGGHGKRKGGLSATEFALRKAREEACGKRGEQWVVERERRKLRAIGRDDLGNRVVHRSIENPGNPWDVESFKKLPPFEPILIEVKSTLDEDDFTINISADQIRQALRQECYYVYRVLSAGSSNPKAYVYLFRDVWASDKINLSAETVQVALPRPQSADQLE
jgi:hypothetical protein